MSGFKVGEAMLRLAPRARRSSGPPSPIPRRALSGEFEPRSWNGVGFGVPAMPPTVASHDAPPADGHVVTLSLVVALSQSRKTSLIRPCGARCAFGSRQIQ